MAMCTVGEVREIASISSNSISDAQMTNLIIRAQKIILEDISHEVVEERVSYIDTYRKNDIDGSETNFYVLKGYNPSVDTHRYQNYIFDRNGDGEVTIADLEVYVYDSNVDPSTKTAATISAVDAQLGRFTLSSAPANDTTKLTVIYRHAPISVDNGLLGIACQQLTAAFGFAKIRADEPDRIALGAIRVSKGMRTFNYYFDEYSKILDRVKTLPKRVD